MASPWEPTKTIKHTSVAVPRTGARVSCLPVVGPGIYYDCPNDGISTGVKLLNEAGTAILQSSATLTGTFTGLDADAIYNVCAVGPGGPGPLTEVSTWLPTDVTGLAPTIDIWPAILAGGLLFQDLARTTPAVADGDVVRCIGCPFLRDSLGAAGDWTLVSGTPAVLRTDGVRWWLDGGATANYGCGSTMTGGSYTLSVMARPNGAASVVQITTSASNILIVTMGTNLGYYRNSGTGLWVGAGSVADTNDVLVWKFTSGDADVYKNGTQVVTTGAWTAGDVTSWRFVGAANGRAMLTRFYGGWASLMDDTERGKMERYLGYHFLPPGVSP